MNTPRRPRDEQVYPLWYKGAVKCFRDLFKQIEAGRLKKWTQLGTEERMTGALIDRITDDVFWKKLNNCIKETKARVQVTWITDKHERSTTGADIGAIIDIDLPDICEEKGILLQAKRFDEAEGVFRDVKREQARKMMEVTAASFYIFYHPEGFRITSASNVQSILPAGQASMDLSLDRLRTIPLLQFSNFMVNYFMKTFVGDGRIHIVNGIRTGKLTKRNLEMVVRARDRNVRASPR